MTFTTLSVVVISILLTLHGRNKPRVLERSFRVPVQNRCDHSPTHRPIGTTLPHRDGRSAWSLPLRADLSISCRAVFGGGATRVSDNLLVYLWHRCVTAFHLGLLFHSASRETEGQSSASSLRSKYLCVMCDLNLENLITNISKLLALETTVA